MKNLFLILSCAGNINAAHIRNRVPHVGEHFNEVPDLTSLEKSCPLNEEWREGKKPEPTCQSAWDWMYQLTLYSKYPLLGVMNFWKTDEEGCFCKAGFVRASKAEDSICIEATEESCEDFRLNGKKDSNTNEGLTNYLMVDAVTSNDGSSDTSNLLLLGALNPEQSGENNNMNNLLMVSALSDDKDNSAAKNLLLVQAMNPEKNKGGLFGSDGNGLTNYLVLDSLTKDSTSTGSSGTTSTSSSDTTKNLLLLQAMNPNQEGGLLSGNGDGLSNYLVLDAITNDGSSSTDTSKLLLVSAMNPNQEGGLLGGNGNGLSNYLVLDALTKKDTTSSGTGTPSTTTSSDTTKNLLLLQAMNPNQEGGLLGGNGNGIQQYMLVDALTGDGTDSDSTKNILLLQAMNGEQGDNNNQMQQYLLLDTLNKDSSSDDTTKQLLLVSAMNPEGGLLGGEGDNLKNYVLLDTLSKDSTSSTGTTDTSKLLLVSAMGQGQENGIGQYLLVDALSKDGADTKDTLLLASAISPNQDPKQLKNYVLLDKLTNKDSKTSATDILMLNKMGESDDKMKNYLMMDKVLNSDGTTSTNDYLLLNQMNQPVSNDPNQPDHVKNYLILGKVGKEAGIQASDLMLMNELTPENRNPMQDYLVVDQLTDSTADSAAKNFMLMDSISNPQGSGKGLSNMLVMDKVLPGESTVKDMMILNQMNQDGNSRPLSNYLLMDKVNKGNIATATATTTNLANDYLMQNTFQNPNSGNPAMGYLTMNQMTDAEKTKATNYMMLNSYNKPSANQPHMQQYLVLDKINSDTVDQATAQNYLLANHLAG